MMKKGIWSVVLVMALVLVFALASYGNSSANASSAIKVVFNKKQLVSTVHPMLKNGRVMMSPETFFKALGAKYTWDTKTNTITAVKGTIKLQMTVGKKTSYRNGKAFPMDVAPVLVKGKIIVPARFVCEAFGLNIIYNSKTKVLVIESYKLPVVGSLNNLKQLLATAENTNQSYIRAGGDELMQKSAAPTAESSTGAGNFAAADYSSTNVQVQGVDESDIVKNDGEYIYQVNNQRVVVAKVNPAIGMNIVSMLNFTESFMPQELYVDQKYLVVIGSSYRNIPVPEPKVPVAKDPAPNASSSTGTSIAPAPDSSTSPAISIAPAEKGIAVGEYYPYQQNQSVKAIIYDISDKTKIKQLREVELEGNYVSSRKIKSSLYLVTNRYLNYYTIMEQGSGSSPAPAYRDTAGANKFVTVGYQDIRYFPGSVESNYLMVAGLNLDKPDQDMQVSTYLGSGQNI
ncbi:MAG: beta-propeller domain-containing protein, partial [Bacillota bacterium]